MVSGPGAEEGKHLAKAAEICYEVSEVHSAKGRTMEGRGGEGCGGKK